MTHRGPLQPVLIAGLVLLGLRSATMGVPIWGSDTGGYWGGTTTHELFARWLGLGAFSPVMEIGPLNDGAPWDMPDGTGYNAEAIAILRTYALLHDHLTDYTARYAKEARETGHPIMRPLSMEYPNDEHAWTIWDEYLYGKDYLVAPNIEKGARSREVYLVETPLYKTPTFLRAGSDHEVLDLQMIYEESLEFARDPPPLPDGN